ncbi:MAG: hypothetical protein JW940_22435, partial [Polyangiaceae bacterium]|nr:hypothetical protein [Polyangiaceae bacterium]
RMLSNQGIEVDEVLRLWVQYVVGDHPSIVQPTGFFSPHRAGPTAVATWQRLGSRAKGGNWMVRAH